MLVPEVLEVDLSPEQLEAIVDYGRRLQLLVLRDALLYVDPLVCRLISRQGAQ